VIRYREVVTVLLLRNMGWDLDPSGCETI